MFPYRSSNAATLAVICCVSALSLSICEAGKVLDIGDQLPALLDKHPEKSWLIKFYAPWCHHCQQLEPIYNNVAERIYHNHDHIIVGRVDCTKYGALCEAYKVDSYPTIIFVSKSDRIKYKGDRNELSMVSFAERLHGPSVNSVERCDQLKQAITNHETIVLSTFRSDLSDISKAFQTIAKAHRASYWFYSYDPIREGSQDKKCITDSIQRDGLYILKKNLNKAISYQEQIKAESSIEESRSEENADNETNQSKALLEWIRAESFPVYAQISSRNIERSLATGRTLVLAILDEYKPARRLEPKSLKFQKDFEKSVIKMVNQEDKYNEFLFGWTADQDMIEYITIGQAISMPNVMILKADLSYHLARRESLDDQSAQQRQTYEDLSYNSLIKLLSQVSQEKVDFIGGNSYIQGILRHTRGNYNKIASMYKANPILVSLLFGFPSAIFLFVVYTTCWYEPADSSTRFSYDEIDEDVEDDQWDEVEQKRNALLKDSHLKQD